jgi:4-hydroxy-tetrahydrodipicolinate synthase
MAPNTAKFSNAKLSTFCCTVSLFDENLKWDEAASRAHFQRVAEAGVGLYVGGSSPGEGYAMSADEIDRLLRVAVEVAGGKVPVRAMGVEPRTAEEMCAFLQRAAKTGVDACQIYSLDVGHGWKPGTRELERYFRAALESVSIPCIISSHAFMGYNAPIEMLERLAKEYDHLVGVNLTTPDIMHLTEAVARLRPRLEIHVGGPMHAITAMAMGANGFLSSEAAIAPRLCQDVIDHFAAGRYEDSFRAYHAVMALMTGVSTMPGASVRRVKAAMRLLGRGGTYPRGPYMPIEEAELTALAKVLRQIGEEHGRPELIPG